MADWITVKLREHELAPYHLATKMGIAATLVRAWKEGKVRPKVCHVRSLVKVLGKYRRTEARSAAMSFGTKQRTSPGAVC